MQDCVTLGLPESQMLMESIACFERPRKSVAHCMVGRTDVENAMLVQRIAHSEAVERQRLHTAVSFKRTRFVR